jgi:hypothetical protein
MERKIFTLFCHEYYLTNIDLVYIFFLVRKELMNFSNVSISQVHCINLNAVLNHTERRSNFKIALYIYNNFSK